MTVDELIKNLKKIKAKKGGDLRVVAIRAHNGESMRTAVAYVDDLGDELLDLHGVRGEFVRLIVEG